MIHCIPQFSQVMPSNKMTVTRRALLQKIKSKGIEKSVELKVSYTDKAVEDKRRIATSETKIYATNNLPPPELTIKAIRRDSSGRKSKTEEIASQSIVPDISIFPKYPRFIHELPRNFSSSASNLLVSSMNNLIVTTEDFEKLSQTNPYFSAYVFLPKFNFFVHPLVLLYQYQFDNHEMCSEKLK